MTEKNFDYNSFSHVIYINKIPDYVFRYIATASGITKWFIGKAEYFYGDSGIRLGDDYAQKGDSFLWKWLNKDLELKGMVIECIKIKEFAFTFSPLFKVTINLAQETGRTRITLKQEYQESAVRDDFNFINCCVCWVFFLTNLKSVIEHGIDLREKDFKDEMLINC